MGMMAWHNETGNGTHVAIELVSGSGNEKRDGFGFVGAFSSFRLGSFLLGPTAQTPFSENGTGAANLWK